VKLFQYPDFRDALIVATERFAMPADSFG